MVLWHWQGRDPPFFIRETIVWPYITHTTLSATVKVGLLENKQTKKFLSYLKIWISLVTPGKMAPKEEGTETVMLLCLDVYNSCAY